MPAHHRRTYGRQAPDTPPPFPKPAADISLSTPVGVVQDRDGRVWVADVGNSRLLVFDRELEQVLAQVGTAGTEPGNFDLPFRLAHHPTARRLFVTDLGNGRIQELSYGRDTRSVDVEQTFTTESESFHPNGIAVHETGSGLDIFVADEFYHEDPTDTRSRVVRFDGDGIQRGSFRSVREDDDEIGLHWP